MVRSVGSKRSTRSRIAIASLAIHFTRRPLASLSCAVGGTKSRASTSARLWRWRAIRWNADSSISALAHASDAIRRQFWNPQIVRIERLQAEKGSPDLIRARLRTLPWPPLLQGYAPEKLSAAAAFKRLEGSRRDRSHDQQIARNHHVTVSHRHAGGADRRGPVRRGSVDRRRGQPAARAHGPGQRDRARAQRLPALRDEQGGGLCPGKIRLRQNPR